MTFLWPEATPASGFDMVILSLEIVMPNLVGGAGLAMEGLEEKRGVDLTPCGVAVGTYAGLLGGIGGGDPRPASTPVFLGKLEEEAGLPCPTLPTLEPTGLADVPPALFGVAATLEPETAGDESAGFSEGAFLSRIDFSLVGDVLLLNCMMARLTLESLPGGKMRAGVGILPGG